MTEPTRASVGRLTPLDFCKNNRLFMVRTYIGKQGSSHVLDDVINNNRRQFNVLPTENLSGATLRDRREKNERILKEKKEYENKEREAFLTLWEALTPSTQRSIEELPAFRELTPWTNLLGLYQILEQEGSRKLQQEIKEHLSLESQLATSKQATEVSTADHIVKWSQIRRQLARINPVRKNATPDQARVFEQMDCKYFINSLNEINNKMFLEKFRNAMSDTTTGLPEVYGKWDELTELVLSMARQQDTMPTDSSAAHLALGTTHRLFETRGVKSLYPPKGSKQGGRAAFSRKRFGNNKGEKKESKRPKPNLKAGEKSKGDDQNPCRFCRESEREGLSRIPRHDGLPCPRSEALKKFEQFQRSNQHKTTERTNEHRQNHQMAMYAPQLSASDSSAVTQYCQSVLNRSDSN